MGRGREEGGGDWREKVGFVERVQQKNRRTRERKEVESSMLRSLIKV